jgi:hypothetical protein
MSPGQPLGRWAGKGEHKMEIMNSGQQKDVTPTNQLAWRHWMAIVGCPNEGR